jgi:RNA polymerase sigma-70 factor (ECF subfamily)
MPDSAPNPSGQSGDSTAAYVDAQKYDQLVQEAVLGSDIAFTSLWRHFQPRMVRYLAMFTKEAEDLSSEVWIKIAGSIGNFDGDAAAFKGWIYTIARNAATDLARTKKRQGTAVELNERDWTGENSTMVEVMDLIKRLPKDYAEVILLRVVADLEVNDVAKIVGKEPGNVRVLTHRGLKQLSDMLEGGDRT